MKILLQPTTIILLESPHRLIKLLIELEEHTKNKRLISVSREITKIHEENIIGTRKELLLHFYSKKVKGEIIELL